MKEILILKILFTVLSILCVSQKVNKSNFINYMERFRPNNVWETLESSTRRSGRNVTLEEQFDEIYKRIDPTDDLLKLKVKNGKPAVHVQKDGRRWRAPVDVDDDNYYDVFHMRERFMELMKQAIFQVRNKMVIMQRLRKKYGQISVYKMGFLMSKTDIACKKFSSIFYKAHKLCSLARQSAVMNYPYIDVMESEHRLLNLWFDVDLLRDLVTINDVNCERMIQRTLTNRKNVWKFVD